MGQARIKQRAAFPPALINEWESEDCVSFAIALARLTGWLIHVDWWVPSSDPQNTIPIEQWKPLRVYVGDNGSRIFDVRGTRALSEFISRTIQPLAMQHGNGGVRTRFYQESVLSSLPLRFLPNDSQIARTVKLIESNQAFLGSIPKRSVPCIPAHEAAKYTFGLCAAFAEALSEYAGLETVGLLATRFKPGWELTERGSDGYFHSIVLHPDGVAEDCWGRAEVSEIADRFGVAEFLISRDAHSRVVARLRHNSPERFADALKAAKNLILEYRR